MGLALKCDLSCWAWPKNFRESPWTLINHKKWACKLSILSWAFGLQKIVKAQVGKNSVKVVKGKNVNSTISYE